MFHATEIRYDDNMDYREGMGDGDGAGKFVLDEDWDEILGTEWRYGKYSGIE